MRTLSIAAMQTAPMARDPDATLDLLAKRTPAVKAAVLTPSSWCCRSFTSRPADCSTSPTGTPIRSQGPCPAPSPSGSAIARASKLWIAAGSVYERSDEGDIHNTAVVVSPKGELAARYRKSFPWRPTERSVPGDGFVTLEFRALAGSGLAICSDGSFPR